MDSDIRSAQIIRTGIINIAVNLLMVAVKLVIGLVTGSIAIVLDAVNNSADAISSIITIAGARLSRLSPDKKHPYGYGRVEYISTVIISFMILAAGGSAVKSSVESLINHQKAEYSLPILLPMIIVVFVKSALGRYSINKGRQLHADALVASGREARYDALVSLFTVLAAVISMNFGVSLEGYIGLVIAILIIKTGAEMMAGTLNSLIGRRSDRELSSLLKDKINSYPGVHGTYDIILHNYGPTSHMASAHMEVDNALSAHEIHILSRTITGDVFDEMGIVLTLGIYSSVGSDPEAGRVRDTAARLCYEDKRILQLHGFYLEGSEVGFDIVVDFKANPEETRQDIIAKLKEIHPEYHYSVLIDLDFSD